MHTMTSVIYRDIPEFPGYRAGDDGSVWTCRRKGGNDRGSDRFTDTWRRMKPHPHNGYLRVSLIRDGRVCSRTVHNLVLMAFVGPCPQGMEGCHYPDPDRANNRLSNLRWDTHSENARDKYRDKPAQDSRPCNRCGVVKPLSDFPPSKRNLNGRQAVCRPCNVEVCVATRDPIKKRAANREYMRRKRASDKERKQVLEGALAVSRGEESSSRLGMESAGQRR